MRLGVAGGQEEVTTRLQERRDVRHGTNRIGQMLHDLDRGDDIELPVD